MPIKHGLMDTSFGDTAFIVGKATHSYSSMTQIIAD